ncbi:hypothetical protein F5Y16DRAFT_417923 [Xylariaceae sp. FL0255]|nr:hypothetical protein F5Y16DRAFT_417923 [Xylariaceae sp. FL0255]
MFAVTIANVMAELLSTQGEICALVDILARSASSALDSRPTIYIDLEGVKLSREGTISILTILIDPTIAFGKVYLVDVHSLGAQAFNTAGAERKTLKDILQDDQVPKAMFDDIQLMESANRKTTASRRFLNGLARCVQDYCVRDNERTRWRRAKDRGESLFMPTRGGSYDIFNYRPMPDDIKSYCAGDVQYLPTLWAKFRPTRTRVQNLIDLKTRERITASQKPDYRYDGPNRALAPWTEEQNKTLDHWNSVPSPPEYFDGYYYHDDKDDFNEIDDSTDFEDFTRAPWQGPPS